MRANPGGPSISLYASSSPGEASLGSHTGSYTQQEAVVTLKEPVVGIRPFMLPPVVGFLDKGNVAGTYLTLVDRGLTTLVGWPDLPAWGDRRYGTLVISDVRSGAIMLSPDQKHPVQVCIGGSGSAARTPT